MMKEGMNHYLEVTWGEKLEVGKETGSSSEMFRRNDSDVGSSDI